MAYDYVNGDGVAVLLVTEPNGAAEPLSNLDNAIRQIKAYLNDPIEGPAALIEALASPVRVITTHTGAVQTIDESDGAVVIQFNNIDLDSGGDFNNGTYMFTAPEDGLYLVVCQLSLIKNASAAPADIHHTLEVMIGGVVGAEFKFYRGTDDVNPIDLPLSRLFNLSAGQTISIRYSVNVTGGTLAMDLVDDPKSTIFQVTRFALS